MNQNSKVSFLSILLALCFFTAFLFCDLLAKPLSQIGEIVFLVLGGLGVVLSLVSGIHSIRNHEKNKWQAVIGVTLSSMIIVFFICMLIYVLIWVYL